MAMVLPTNAKQRYCSPGSKYGLAKRSVCCYVLFTTLLAGALAKQAKGEDVTPACQAACEDVIKQAARNTPACNACIKN